MSAIPQEDVTQIDQLAERIGCFGLGSWLTDLGRWLGAPSPYPPIDPQEFSIAAGKAVSLRLHAPAWRQHTSAAADDWVLYDATIAGSTHLPFDLRADVETPASATGKLSTDVSWSRTAKGDPTSVTHFLPDLRVVIVRFTPSLVGIEEIRLTRLFAWPDWRKRTKVMP